MPENKILDKDDSNSLVEPVETIDDRAVDALIDYFDVDRATAAKMWAKFKSTASELAASQARRQETWKEVDQLKTETREILGRLRAA